jgi:hypothetical protein
VWFWLGLGTFLIGYAIAFGLELGGRSSLGNFGYVKWWLTRFMLPACLLCLTGLVLALAPRPGSPVTWRRRIAWGLVLLVGCFGPCVEFAGALARHFEFAAVDPFAHRLNLLAHVDGSHWAGNPFAQSGNRPHPMIKP